MIIVNVEYLKDINAVDEFLVEHRTFLDELYRTDVLLASGPKEPRTGGILLSLLNDQSELEKIIQQDPFHREGIAKYTFTKFIPVKHRDEIQALIK